MVLSYAQIEQRRQAGKARAAKLTSQQQSQFAKQAVKANEESYGTDPRGKSVWHVMGGKASVKARLGVERIYPVHKSIKAARLAALKVNGGSHTEEQWEQMKRDHDYKCLCCGRKEPFIKLTRDHIKAISRGGSNDISNIQPLCISCNARKNAGWGLLPKYASPTEPTRLEQQQEFDQLRLEHLLAGD